ncbi:transcriptional activator hap3 [Lithohypha guttulata]|nr:transcriptional activator hap3 [Lithohypha guttulata]
MATSPPKDTDVEQNQSGEDEGDMSRQDEAHGGGLGDFEVKEQDRWLPIANGWFPLPPMCYPILLKS